MSLATVLASCGPAPARPLPVEGDVLVLEGVTLIDGRPGDPIRRARIVIEGGRIRSVEAAPRFAPPAGAQVLDLHGRWVIPGLVDAHVHVATDPEGEDADVLPRLERAFAGGVTMVRDMAGDARALRELAAAAADPARPIPRIAYAALAAGPSFFDDPRAQSSARGAVAGEVPWLRAVGPDTDLGAVVEGARDTGATGLKVYADLEPGMVRVLAAEARGRGMPVWAHFTLFPTRPSETVAAGVDVVSHVHYLVWEQADSVPGTYAEGRRRVREMGRPPPPDPARLRPLFQAMRARRTLLEPTLHLTHSREGLRHLEGWSLEAVRMAREAGVEMVAGTDGMVGPRGGPNLHLELELLVRAGLSPAEAIRAATSNAARALGLSGSHGSVEAGKAADLVVLDADPLADVGNTRSVHLVVKGGRPFRPPRRLSLPGR